MVVVKVAAVRYWVVLFAAAAAGLGCGAKPPYRVSESLLPSAQELRRLWRIELADSAGPGPTAATPRVWIGVPDRRAEGAVIGGLAGVVVGGSVGAAAASRGGAMFP